MFQRFALAPIGIIEEPTNKKLAFASEENKDENVYFDYDPDNFVYFRCRAITADAANGNGDFFPEDEIKKSYKSFIGVGLYKDHDSNSVDKSIGKVLWAEWVPSGKYVECYCAVDKKLAPDLAHRVKVGIATSVSMGCAVAEAECSICHNIAHNVNELCTHMQPGFGMKGRKAHDESIIYEINRGIQFNELSLVTVPADPTARIFEIYAGMNMGLTRQAGVETSPSVELERIKKWYIEMHTPALMDAVGMDGKQIVDKLVRVGEGKLEDLRRRSPVLYNQFLEWVQTHDFLVAGQLGPLSDVTTVTDASATDLDKYARYLPFLNVDEYKHPKRAAVVESFLRDIKYRETRAPNVRVVKKRPGVQEYGTPAGGGTLAEALAVKEFF